MMASKDQQITQLMEMGFGNNRVVRALQATAFKVENTGLSALKYFTWLYCALGRGGRDGVAAGTR